MQSASFDITFVTYGSLPKGDPDDGLALSLLAERGHRTQIAVWNDRHLDWSKAGLCILRSTWDYHLHYDAFMTWLDKVSTVTRLLNPIDLLRWNINKCSYLAELQEHGAPVIESVFISHGGDVDLKQLLDEHSWKQAIIKPGVGAGTYGVKRFANQPDSIAVGQQHLQKLAASGDVMIQPYLRAVDADGERALVFIDGIYSHAVSKTPFQKLLPTGHAGEKSVDASKEEIDIAKSVVSMIKPTPLYARVDLVPDNDGVIKLLELELMEPSLFLSIANSNAAVKFADAVEKHLVATSGAKA